MSNERRYSEEEIAAIFEKAAESQATGRRAVAGSTGLTLAELHEIGREVGIAPELVTEAAQSLSRPLPAVAQRRVLGISIGVGRKVDLGRRLTDDEWERLVADLRDTFGAAGRVQQHGSLRQWSNGNLKVLLEPGENGHQLRMQTMKGSALSTLAVAGTTLGGGLLGLFAILGRGQAGDLVTPVVLTATGIGLFGYLRYSVPRWARERADQMAAIAQRWFQR
ncbi:MAG: hypothetical protein AB7L66_00610 [Gemmatimonadales bacterium]